MCGNWEQDAYTKLENSETGVRVEQSPDEDAMYYLIRIEAQLARMETWNELGGSGIHLGTLLLRAKAYAQMLRNVLDKDAV